MTEYHCPRNLVETPTDLVATLTASAIAAEWNPEKQLIECAVRRDAIWLFPKPSEYFSNLELILPPKTPCASEAESIHQVLLRAGTQRLANPDKDWRSFVEARFGQNDQVAALFDRLQQVAALKHDRVADQDFEGAARHRDEADRIRSELTRLCFGLERNRLST